MNVEGVGHRRDGTRRPAPVLAIGRAVGASTVTGVGRYISSARDLNAFRPGEILMAEFTLPEWRSVMQTAAAIVTNRGGRASNAAVMAKTLGVPAVVGTVDGASRLWTGATLTISCEPGGVGRVYGGLPALEGAEPTPAAREPSGEWF
jgi:pyruvate,water dikinase